jgi:uncharacterized protein YbaA (DUF1428 family)
VRQDEHPRIDDGPHPCGRLQDRQQGRRPVAARVITAFYGSAEAAQKAADEVNSGKVTDFSDAVVVPVKQVSA